MSDQNSKLPARRRRKLSPAAIEQLNALPKQGDHQEISDLPKWAKLALAKQAVEGISRKAAAAEYGKSEQSLHNLANSPAGKKWREALDKTLDDPVRVAEMMIRANAVGVTFDAFWALESAKEQNDYKEVGLIARDMMDRIPELRKQTQAVSQVGKHQIVINLGVGASLDPIEVDSEHISSVEAGSVVDAEIVES